MNATIESLFPQLADAVARQRMADDRAAGLPRFPGQSTTLPTDQRATRAVLAAIEAAGFTIVPKARA